MLQFCRDVLEPLRGTPGDPFSGQFVDANLLGTTSSSCPLVHLLLSHSLLCYTSVTFVTLLHFCHLRYSVIPSVFQEAVPHPLQYSQEKEFGPHSSTSLA